jgi:phosphoglycolate phosphatase
MIRTVLFDLDGTLADTAPDLADALNRVLVEAGRAPLPYERIRPEASYGGKGLVQLGFGVGPDDARFADWRARFLECYAEKLCAHTTLMPGMGALLDALEQRGLNWGIVTNKPAFLTDPLVAQLGLARRAACVVSGDTTANSKPHPEPILHACRLAGSLPQQCIYVGDAERDVQAGLAAGMKTLGARFGYIRPNDRPEDWGADALIDAPSDILNWLERHD